MTDERRTVYIVHEGEYSDYRVLCACENEGDARRAVEAGVGDGYTKLPLLPDGHIPRKVAVHHATVRRDGVITHRSTEDDWDFSEFAVLVVKWGTPATSLYVSGLDKARVEEEAQKQAARLRAEAEGLTSP
ncbi:hypothetical protein [Micromonospora wenchangensis]|uniref:hypothetical protein n=1 Tax=Micromonospora wenchangensis TaxID=1185415 RepID=UPI00381C938A